MKSVLVIFNFFHFIVAINVFNHSVTYKNISSNKFPSSRVLYTWSNGTVIKFNTTLPKKPNHINCLGLGSSVENALEWYFNPNAPDYHSLDIRFLVSSKNKPHPNIVLTGDQFGLDWTDLKIQRNTVIIVHGFLSQGNESWIEEMRNGFLMDDVNVVVVDWSAHGNTWNYYRAAVNAKLAGQKISKFLSHIVNATLASASENPANIKWGSIHMVGHSLGAHICGIAADAFKKLSTPWKITRITGLDPAQPCFTNTDNRLDVSDAPFVDVIHTNGNLLSQLGLGLPESIGHLDFYPNGGRVQLGCMNEISVFDNFGIPKSAIKEAICSHGRSYIYFIESLFARNVTNGIFWGHRWNRSYRSAIELLDESCDKSKCVEMGINAAKYNTQGSFFVATSSSIPFYEVRESDIVELKEELLRNDQHLD